MSIQNVVQRPAAGAALTVEPIASPRDRMRFIRLPWQVYAGNRCWVPPLPACSWCR